MNRFSLAKRWNYFFVSVTFVAPLIWALTDTQKVIFWAVFPVTIGFLYGFAWLVNERCLGSMAAKGTYWKGGLYLLAQYHLGLISSAYVSMLVTPDDYGIDSWLAVLAFPLGIMLWALTFSLSVLFVASFLFAFVLRFLYARRDYLPEVV